MMDLTTNSRPLSNLAGLKANLTSFTISLTGLLAILTTSAFSKFDMLSCDYISLKSKGGKACQVFRPTVHMTGLGSSHQLRNMDADSYTDICGNCGHELNLSSSGRNTSTIGSKYGKSIKRGIISFFYIDESRFTQVEELRCGPFISKNSWGLFRRRTKLLCRKCGNLIGMAYDDHNSAYPLVTDGLDSASGTEISNRRKYDVRIRALQPSSTGEVGIPLAV